MPVCQNKTQGEIIVNPQPLKINLDTPTDWPIFFATLLVGVGSILITLLVGWLSSVNQRTQIESSIATFRHKWIEDLRESVSRFIALGAKIHYEQQINPNFLVSEKLNDIFSELMQTQAYILLMLDRKKAYTDELSNFMDEVVNGLRKNSEEDFLKNSESFANKASDVLELGWQDIKRDLKNRSLWR